MENLRFKHFIFGKEAVDEIMSNGITESLLQCDYQLFLWDEQIHGPEDILDVSLGYEAYMIIEKDDFEFLNTKNK